MLGPKALVIFKAVDAIDDMNKMRQSPFYKLLKVKPKLMDIIRKGKVEEFN